MAEISKNKRKNAGVEAKGKTIANKENHDELEKERLREILHMKDDEKQLDFILNSGQVQDCNLSLPYRTQLSSDRWNLFLRAGFEMNNLCGYLKDFENIRAMVSVNIYDKGGHEFEMMLKKWMIGSDYFFVFNRGWFNFCNQHLLKEDDVIAIRTFRHRISKKLSFLVTYKKC
ncbi:hypothetical protein Fmac_030280 [Flemingia macrophylla]|uniref:TF-B3 domain-containing protein n=1 Tax=Flemingia macrophylla TaxID=520843 RepID=A0ABD1LCQ8_9FABA